MDIYQALLHKISHDESKAQHEEIYADLGNFGHDRFSHEILIVPVIVPLNQSIDHPKDLKAHESSSLS